MKTAIYLRKSRSEELNNPIENTLRRHKEQLLEFSKNNNLEIAEIYEEVVSGDTLCSRPKMLQLLSDVENGLYEAVLCMDIDRLGRGAMSEQGVILETFKQSNTKIITPRKLYDLNNDIDETYSEFETFIARQELKQIKRRFRRGIEKSLHDGGYIANAPYGYSKTKQNKLPTLQMNQEEAYFVRMIFDMYVNQGIGTHIIAQTISDLGAKPRRSERFARTSVRKILMNPVYIGKIVWNQKTHVRKGSKGNDKNLVIYHSADQWTYVDGIHPAIIDEETYRRAQEILKGRHHPPYYKGTVENALAGLVRCGNCGALMQRRISGQACRVAYLICPTAGCVCSVQHAFVEETVVSFLEKRLAAIAIEPKEQKPPDTEILDRSLKSIQKELALARQQSAKLHDLLEQGVYDSDTFLSRYGILEEKAALLESQKKACLQAASREKDGNLQIIHKIKNVLEAFTAGNAQVKNRMLKSVISEIIYSKEKHSKPRDYHLLIQMRAF
ncbi:recombinase family protein [Oscillospiraceae bacterium PP1C4]